ncbi:winged helix-turn-helix transcriptional regulator [Halopseudomonas aestusnigri]|uniref:Transcriptional regulator, HxlR family n=1 Tax=Halopseudomonas aestusnigri TaxID=857252 RepID=A0AAQ1G5S6_9GAMM|nr:helix-turn-helix domain-containing protein [Halopseudomonas aestusnigri]OWL90318.1 transcriptional regulator [Halopseudomonas aestusnigri]SEF91313.1 transcriptional regulator, HxlR family [Halopseudomonas aestusnigri]
MQRNKLTHVECPIARSLDQVGEWWSILLMRDALQGLRRFDQFSQSLGIAPNMLTRRLNALVEAGMLERVPYSQRPLRYEYVPTAKGEDFASVLMAFVDWGNRHYATEGESVQVVDRDTGRRLQLAFTDPEDGRVLVPQQCTVQPGPAASDAMRERLGREYAPPALTT